jgi:hypothetical protein
MFISNYFYNPLKLYRGLIFIIFGVSLRFNWTESERIFPVS